MKLIRTEKKLKPRISHNIKPRRPPWKVLVVDDEEDIHKITALNLSDFIYKGRELQLIYAFSAKEAQTVLFEQPDIAISLIDVVMEKDDAGLNLVKYIRDKLKNKLMRLLVRTGQPGIAPERYVIDHYDIDGYNDKTELTMQKLYTVIRSALKSYNDLKTIDMNRIGLSRILMAGKSLYHDHPDSLQAFFEGVLTQIINLFQLGESGLITTIEGMVMTFSGDKVEVQAGTGEFSNCTTPTQRIVQIGQLCMEKVLFDIHHNGLREDSLVIPMEIQSRPVGFVYLEHVEDLNADDLDLLKVLVNLCANALENLQLNMELTQSYQNIVDILAMVAEYKDSTTGEHIERIAHYTTCVAMELGVPKEEAIRWGNASRLHDVGKVGIADAVLQKPGKLSLEEYEEIKMHTEIGHEILSSDKWMTLARNIATNHHEHWDGGGYPNGLKGIEIELPTRIVSVVDVYDALTHTRPYKQAWLEEEAIAYINNKAGTQFDPKVVKAFIRLHTNGTLELPIDHRNIQ
jgi:response regulator RpfG family c-di-GMP phosphodiesterase